MFPLTWCAHYPSSVVSRGSQDNKIWITGIFLTTFSESSPSIFGSHSSSQLSIINNIKYELKSGKTSPGQPLITNFRDLVQVAKSSLDDFNTTNSFPNCWSNTWPKLDSVFFEGFHGKTNEICHFTSRFHFHPHNSSWNIFYWHITQF